MKTGAELEREDPTFVDDLIRSHAHVRTIAEYFQKAFGVTIVLPPLIIRDDADKRQEFADHGDFLIQQPIECKQRTLHFTCAADFPYDTVIIDRVHAFDRKHPKPFAYVITNKAVTHAAVILRTTRSKWRKITRNHGHRNELVQFYDIPKEHCLFWTLNASETDSKGQDYE